PRGWLRDIGHSAVIADRYGMEGLVCVYFGTMSLWKGPLPGWRQPARADTGQIGRRCEPWVPASTLRYGWSPLSAGGSTCKRTGSGAAFTAPNLAGTGSGKQTARRTPGWMME